MLKENLAEKRLQEGGVAFGPMVRMIRSPEVIPVLATAGWDYIVVDTEGGGFMKFGLAAGLARHLKAKHYSIENLRANDLVRMVKEVKHAHL